MEKFYQQCDPGELARARVPPIRRARASDSHDSVAFVPETCGPGGTRLGEGLCDFFCVFVAETKNLFLWIWHWFWGWLGFLIRSIPWILGEFVLCWFSELFALKLKAKLLCFLPQAEKFGRDYSLLVWCFDPVAED